MTLTVYTAVGALRGSAKQRMMKLTTVKISKKYGRRFCVTFTVQSYVGTGAIRYANNAIYCVAGCGAAGRKYRATAMMA